jgi:hypothetical protein
MVVTARADLLYCLIGRLLSFPELTALVSSAGGWQSGSGPRISGSIQDGWAMPTAAIWLKKSGGPPGDYEIGEKTSRVDIRCYGAKAYEADHVWAMLDAILVPATGDRTASFVLNGVHVSNIRPEGDAITDREPDTQYPYVWAPYLVDWISA